jgi:glyoxylase-like metal-dependent hydrolase (beta-lactamase superfamily II)
MRRLPAATRCSAGLHARLAVALTLGVLASPRTFAAPPAADAALPDWCRTPQPAELASLERVASSQPWFEVYRIRPAVFAIYEPGQYEQVISYLILGEKRALLFDSGLGLARMADLVRELTSLPVTVLNSHTHFDHVGGNAEFDDVWNMDMPYSRESVNRELDEYARQTLAPDRLCAAPPPEVTSRVYAVRPWKVSRRIGDGERIDLGGRELEILHTPGHAPDALCLLDRREGLLFTGDTFYIGPIYLFAPGTDMATYTRSVDRLASLVPELKLLLPAHTIPVAEPSALIALRDALRSIQSGSVQPTLVDGHLEYAFDRFSLLLAPE